MEKTEKETEKQLSKYVEYHEEILRFVNWKLLKEVRRILKKLHSNYAERKKGALVHRHTEGLRFLTS